MSRCKCESIKIYDGEHRCMMCYQLFRLVPVEDQYNRRLSQALGLQKMNPSPRYFINPDWSIEPDETI